MTVITVLPDGRVIAKATVSAVHRLTAGPLAITVTVGDVRKVEEVLKWKLTADPQTNWSPVYEGAEKNVVGATIYVASGTTLSGEVIVLGY